MGQAQSRQESCDLGMQGQSSFQAPLCARVLPYTSSPVRMSAIHAIPASCPPGCWLDLLKRAGWPVGPQIWCPLFTWADAELNRCTENTLGIKTLLSFTPFSQQRIKQPFVFMVGYFHQGNIFPRRANWWGQEGRAQLVNMCLLTPPQDLAWSILSQYLLSVGKEELLVLITSQHERSNI